MNHTEREILKLLRELMGSERVTRAAILKIANSIQDGSYLHAPKNTVSVPRCDFPLDTVTVRSA